MAIGGPTILNCGDDCADLEMHIAEICGIEISKYLQDTRLLTRDKFQNHFDEVLELAESWAPSVPEYNNIAWQVIGAFILKLGAKLPEDIRDRIIESTNWETDQRINWPENWILQRVFYLNDLKEKIKKHKYGEKTHLLQLLIVDDSEFPKCCIGLKQFELDIESGRIKDKSQLYLDSCRLKTIPESVLQLNWIKVLSLCGNQLTLIPENISSMSSLEEIFLNYNYIKDLPESLIELENLECLELSDNCLENLPNVLIELEKKRVSLSLWNNLAKDVPPNLIRYTK